MSLLKRFRLWRQDRKYGPLTLDCCETCKKPLRQRERVEVMVGDTEYAGEYGGFTAVIASFCKEHTPC